jgi:hypothetical protein
MCHVEAWSRLEDFNDWLSSFHILFHLFIRLRSFCFCSVILVAFFAFRFDVKYGLVNVTFVVPRVETRDGSYEN